MAELRWAPAERSSRHVRMKGRVGKTVRETSSVFCIQHCRRHVYPSFVWPANRARNALGTKKIDGRAIVKKDRRLPKPDGRLKMEESGMVVAMTSFARSTWFV